MSHKNVMSCGNAMSYGNSTPRLMEIIISTTNFVILHAKYHMLPHVSMHVEMKL